MKEQKEKLEIERKETKPLDEKVDLEAAGKLRAQEVPVFETKPSTPVIFDTLETIFPEAECELRHRNVFELLVSVVLSAQATDVSVNKVTPALFARWPNPEALMNAKLEEVEEIIKSIGLYRNKAKHLIALSRILVDDFHGQVPQDFQALQTLPGVGRKTANVVRSEGFHIPSFAVDTHVERVSKRLGIACVEDSVGQVEEALKEQLEKARWNQGHQDMIYFGRYFCTAKKPNCEVCPFRSFCHKEQLSSYQALKKAQAKAKKEEQEG